jgi:hypothetical protein
MQDSANPVTLQLLCSDYTLGIRKKQIAAIQQTCGPAGCPTGRIGRCTN